MSKFEQPWELTAGVPLEPVMLTELGVGHEFEPSRLATLGDVVVPLAWGSNDNTGGGGTKKQIKDAAKVRRRPDDETDRQGYEERRDDAEKKGSDQAGS